MTPRARQASSAPTPNEQHAEWLALLRPDGPFLALSVLTETWPQGIETISGSVRDRIRQAWAEVSAAPDLLTADWQDLVLRELLEYRTVPADQSVGAWYGDARPDEVLYGPNVGGDQAVRLHIYRHGPDVELIKAVRGQPALSERAAQVCRDSRVPLALLTNGRLWVLVHAKSGEPTSVAVFDADLWFEEPALLRAFGMLLSAVRVTPPPETADGMPSYSLAGLFARSTAAQADVTTTLGNQVRRAVELLVGEVARLDREAGGELLLGVSERDIYRGALTVLMRLVFLLYAEEQRLLPINDPVYASGYAVSTLFDQLVADRTSYGDEIGDRRSAAWQRLLALFGAIHAGCEHPDLRIPAYGGSLFDPDEFVWLRRAGVTDRVIYRILDALLILRHLGQAAERLSYRGLDVEQIGHVYEGLLEYSCRRVAEPFVGLIGKRAPEVRLTDLESAGTGPEFVGWVRDTCGLTAKQAERALGATPGVDQLGALHAACDNDSTLTERVRPYWGLIRPDLRGQPTVFPAGSVLFTRVGDRRSTGTHYTPRALAEEVVQHTLAPLCYTPGPAEGVEPGVWRPKTAHELLKLKVVDPAMGSGAFLVSACRYLADRIVESWERDGVPNHVGGLLDGDDDQAGLQLAARRMVAARCLYGVDRDDMAVELAKLSLWLVTLAKNKPFGFVDHALRCGDSLIGLRTAEQVVGFHLDPERGWLGGTNLVRTLNDQIDKTLVEATELRRRIEDTVVQDPRDADEKAATLRRVERLTARLRLAADGVVGAALSTAVRVGRSYEDRDDEPDMDHRLGEIAEDVDQLLRADEHDLVDEKLRETIEEWLRGPRPQPIRPFHWSLEFPEVMSRGGFDAVVGNPPFIGGKRVSGAVGKDVREYLKEWVARDKPGNADLCSYFLLRDLDITANGRVGIIATNTIAQGDTREVGLDQAVAGSRGVYRATKSQPWPGTASLEVSLVWVGHIGDHEQIVLDGRNVSGITPSLDPRSRISGNPYRLVANEDQSFIGCYALGMGFILESSEACELIKSNSRNEDVLFPYLNGEDLNTRPDFSARRWAIDFNDRTVEQAMTYPGAFSIVEKEVRPHRQRKNPDGTYVLRRPLPDRWWQYADKRPAMRQAITGLDRVLVIALVSKTGLPVWVSTGQVFSHALGVFAVDRDAYLTLLSSSMHFAWWTTKGESSLRADPRYTPSDGFETFVQPDLTGRMDEIGRELHEFRRGVMLDRQLGLTKVYNLVHDAAVADDDIGRLRGIHVEVDRAVAEAYGWTDLGLGHDFYETRQGRRFTVDPVVQVEILDRLLELNHQRHAEELRQGVVGGKRKTSTKRGRKIPTASDGGAGDAGMLF